MPIMGYNYGAAKKDRLMQTYKEALKIALLVMALGLLLFQALHTGRTYLKNRAQSW